MSGRHLPYAKVGELLPKARVWTAVAEYLEAIGSPPSLPGLMGELKISPQYKDVVEETFQGNLAPESEVFERPEEGGWQLDAIIDQDGEEYLLSGGRVDMVVLHLPVENVMRKTRLDNELHWGEISRGRRCNFSTQSPRTMARHFVQGYGIQDPKAVGHILHVEDYYSIRRRYM